MTRSLFFSAMLAIASVTTALAQPAAPVVIAPLEEAEVSSSQAFVATVMPRREAVIGSAVAGRVSEFYFDEGDAVEAGQPIAQILTETIKLQIAAAKAELELRTAELEELKNGSREEELAQSKAEMMSAKARKDYLVARRNRTADLYETRRVSSKEEYDEAISAAEAASEAFNAAEAAHGLMVKGPRIEKIAQAQARVQVQEAVVGELEDKLKKYTIRSRFNGYISRKHTDVGSWAEQGADMVDVVELDEVDITAYVAEHHVPYVVLGAEVRIEVSAIPDRIFTGTVVAIVPQADVRTRTFPVKVRVTNEIQNGVPLLKAGMLARVQLPTGGTKQALLCPKDALVLGAGKAAVYITAPGPNNTTIVQLVPVQLGVTSGDRIEIIGQIPPGSQVVTRGNERLRPGQAINVLARTESLSSPTSTSRAPR
ncbi:efflux RND transporter periplasmic adaptor subunit [Blastopirellula sp. J2-11]|uniref:efflux RND transporter periplasmic adaptor subunit n=1 Tax=Blastopirellula sp. J2-11 TaxID=2943192 RepID=UPI0021C6BB21|nr:efflux RND transporter periplasmic adaptor subunit [Blastopirellula sp. J2-11]UUO08820.1 efflux RND transporter periplasmic adaptor subunit [Blastopirellula sp. J2-11]